MDKAPAKPKLSTLQFIPDAVIMYSHQEHWIEIVSNWIGCANTFIFLACMMLTAASILDGWTMIVIWVCLGCMEYLKERVCKPFLYWYVDVNR